MDNCTETVLTQNKEHNKLYLVTSCCIIWAGTKNLTRSSSRYGWPPDTSWHIRFRRFNHNASPFRPFWCVKPK